MMRMLITMVIVLSTSFNVSAQTFSRPSPSTYANTEHVDAVNYPFTELTEVRLWGPDQNGKFQWWALVREHQGPKWQRRGVTWTHVNDNVVERWVPGQAPVAEERQPVRHSTIDVWKLRDEELRKMEQQRLPRPQHLEEPVYRIQKGDEQEEPKHASPQQEKVPQKKQRPAAPKSRENVRPSGPTYFVKNCSSGN